VGKVTAPKPTIRVVLIIFVLVVGIVVAVVAGTADRPDDRATDDRNTDDRATDALVATRPHEGEPWSLRLSDPSGAEVLRTVESGLEVVTAKDAYRSTKVLATDEESSGQWRARVATANGDDRRGPDLSVSLRTATDGVIGLRVEIDPRAGADTDNEVAAMSVEFGADADERYLGLGQRATGVDHRGQEVENRVLDGPWTDAQIGVVESVIPPVGFSERRDATYFPLPWVLSTAGYGILVDNDETSRFALATPAHPDRSRLEVDAAHLELRVFAGPEPADVLERMTTAIGRQPPPGAPFVLGPWWQPHDDEEAELAALQTADVPMSVAQTYTHYLPCGDHQGQRDREREHTARMHDAGLAVTAYVNPMVCVDYTDVYDQGVATGAFTAAPDGEPYQYPYFTSQQFEVVQFDFSAAAGRELFHRVLDLVVEDGYDGWMEDFGEYTPVDAVSDDGTPGPAMHNRYVEQFRTAAQDYATSAPRPLARYSRSGWTGAVAASPIVWGGDPTTAWGFDGLESAMHSGLGMALSGVSTWGSDIGGFFSVGSEELTPELLNRWIQFGAMSGVMRLQSDGLSIGGGPRAQVLDAEVLPVWRRYAKLRTQLYPYVAGATEHYGEVGLPVMRHLALTHPDDPDAVERDDQYFFGADLLVAPVTEPGVDQRQLYLPEGEWFDLWRSSVVEDDGSLTLDAATVRTGGRSVTVDAPEQEIPVQVRSGAVLPLLPADVDTLADYGADTEGLVRLADREADRTLLAFPGPAWRGPLGPGEEIESQVQPNGQRWTLTLRAERGRTYALQASLAAMDKGFVPCSVQAHGRDVDFAFDPATRVLTSSVDLPESGQVVVDACD
jgi:alpha-glucosidase (family GH31 glycosyl hydrolase)